MLTLIAAVLVSSASILEKKTLFHQHAMEFLTALSLCTMLLTLPLFLWLDNASLSLASIGLIYIASSIGALAALFTAKALRHIAISLTSPFLAFGPLITLIMAAIFLGEKVSWLQGTGILVLMGGAYLLESHAHDDLLEPFKHFFKLKYVRYMLLAILLYGIGSVLDKRILGAHADGGLGISTLTYLPLAQFFQAINFIVMMLLFHDGFKGIEKGIKHSWKPVLFIGILLVGSRLAYMYALSLPGVLVSLLIPVKKLSVLFSTIIGGELFHEEHVIRRSLACLIMLIGAVLILL
jgi:drug/metabolite transporter (DMT)-like permease